MLFLKSIPNGFTQRNSFRFAPVSTGSITGLILLLFIFGCETLGCCDGIMITPEMKINERYTEQQIKDSLVCEDNRCVQYNLEIK